MSDRREKASFLSELKRRKVTRSLIGYVVVCWALIQIGEVLLPVLGVEPETPLRYVLFLSIIGAPICFALAWFYQITDKGIVRTASFEERRVLNNLSPVNDRRNRKVGKLVSQDQTEYQWLILFQSGPLEGLTYGVHNSIVLGRALECDITVLTNHVSRQHAVLKIQDNNLTIDDLGSANGTQVNGKTIDETTILKHDDEVLLQDVMFTVSQSYNRSATESSALNQTMVVNNSDS